MKDTSETVQSCCFTGHRPRALPNAGDETTFAMKILKQILYNETQNMIQNGVIHFYCGGAQGFDILCGEAVLHLKQQYQSINLHMVLPYYKDPQEDTRYSHLLEEAQSITYIARQYHQGCMHERNRYLVDHAAHCIAYLTKKYSGTMFTVTYARRSGLHVINLADLLFGSQARLE